MAEKDNIQSLHLDEDYSLWSAELKSRYHIFYSRPEYEQKLKQAVSQFEGYTNTHPYPILFIKYMTK